jgi:hypothetical protein
MNRLLRARIGLVSFAAILFSHIVFSAAAPVETGKPSPGDRWIGEYFKRETSRLESSCLDGIDSREAWEKKRPLLRRQLFEMLSLDPLPPRTDLHSVVTGRVEQPEFTVENLQFQSLPGFYATANLYLPRDTTKPVPTILYLCGHASVVTNGVSFGNKTAYHHHGVWFARHGFACLILDSVQLGEIQGIHHGTHREGMWWWNSRGYTPAGAEAWNCIRALDYLESRPEIDATRFGVTGRSGGGAYSWWIAALDDRIKAAAPVAGITDLRNHVIGGTVEGHCDCMFMVNTYRWDYAAVAALVAPRPLLLCNSDKDYIFPLDGVVRVHSKVANIYRLLNASNSFGLLITEGPHKDTQDLQLPVFRWFNRHLKGEDPVIETAAVKILTPQQLKTFKTTPDDERTSRIHESFVAPATPLSPPQTPVEWLSLQPALKDALLAKSFRAWPAKDAAAQAKEVFSNETNGMRLDVHQFEVHPDLPLNLYSIRTIPAQSARQIVIEVLDEAAWTHWAGLLRTCFNVPEGADWIRADRSIEPRAASVPSSLASLIDRLNNDTALALVVPRGIGPSAWNPTERAQVQIRRRFMLLGQTLDSMRVWDVRRGLQAVRALPHARTAAIQLRASGDMAVNALYAALFEPPIQKLVLSQLPSSHHSGPDYLNVLRILDIPTTVAMVAETTPVRLEGVRPADWSFPRQIAERLPGREIEIVE